MDLPVTIPMLTLLEPMVTDILICSVPAGIINRPPAALALLRACVEQAGFTCRTQDLSLNLYIEQCDKNYQRYQDISRLFEPLTNFEMRSEILQWLDQCVQLFKTINPRFIGLSVFSSFQHKATVMLAQHIRQHLPDVQIIVGGYGLRDNNFFATLQEKNLADHFVHDEGENKLVDILQDKLPSHELVNLQTLPVPNFDDYNFDQYLWHNEPVLTITGSKGCVRACTFCNVPRTFGRYRRRTGQQIAHEMIELQKRYGINKFEFTDSLVNGSQRDFVEFVQCLAQYNSTSNCPISWYGQYICRPQSQVPAGIYALIKQSGCVNLIIGAESGNNDVLAAMNKKMTAQDIMHELEQFELHGLQAQLLMLSGFYNETWPRFVETLTFIVKLQRYVAAGVVSRINMGIPLMIETDGYLHQHAEDLGIIIDPNSVHNWRVHKDPTNTWLERLRRRIIVQAVFDHMNIPLTGNGIIELYKMLDLVKIYEQQLRSPNTTIGAELAHDQAH